MKLSKRMLAVLCTLLMLASCFALPYGALAAEDVADDAVVDNIGGKVVATLQKEETTVKQGGNQWVGKSFELAEPFVYAEGKNAKDYMITLEIKLHQDYGFTDPGWIFKCLGDGNMIIRGKDADGNDTSKTNPIYFTSMLQNAGIDAEDKWFTACVPLSSLTGVSFKKLEFNTYVHACKWDPTNYPTDDSKCKNGCSISYRNVVIRDMTRTADGGPNKVVAAFGQPGVEVTATNNDGAHTVTCIPTTYASYNVITSDMDTSKLNVEFDIMYTSNNKDFNPIKIVNGSVRLYDPNERNSGAWSNSGEIAAKDKWYHFSIPLTKYTFDDITKIERIYAFNYNDATVDGVQTNPGFTSHVKNMVITHSDVTALENALEAAKTFVYDVDDNATAYETALNKARGLFTSTTSTYADFATTLAELNAAKANVTSGRDLVSEVGHFTGGETEYKNVYSNNSGSIIFMDWKWVTGMNLTDGKTYSVTKNDVTETRGVLGENRYLVATVTVSRNADYTGDLALGENDPLPALNKLAFRLRSDNKNGTPFDKDNNTERRTNDFNTTIVNKVKNADGSETYTLEALLTSASDNWYNNDVDRRVDWSAVRSIFGNWNFNSQIAEKANNSATNIIMDVQELKIVNRTVDAIEAGLKEAAEGYITPGKYTAESTAEYLTYKEQAQAMLEDDGATLQEKMQLITKVDEAKAKFVPIVTEYVQFGEPESITTWTNTGIDGKHSQQQAFTVSANNLTGSEDLNKLQLRFDVFVTRGDGLSDISNVMVNGNINLYGASGDLTEYGFGTGGGALLAGLTADKWNTVYIDATSFTRKTAATVDLLKQVTGMRLFAYNDLRGGTSDPSVTVQVKNVAIVDNTNVAAVEDMKNLFADVTNGGTVDFTPDSYAAYKAVFDEWYDKAYATVDLTQYEAAKAALEEAYKGLVCVDKTVMTFNTHWCKGWDSNGTGFYADWRDADQGTVDTSIRNYDNLVIRFDISVAAKEGYTLPETLTTTGMRLAVRKWNGGEDPEGHERSIDFYNTALIPSLDTTKVNTIEVPFTAYSFDNNTDGLLKSIILWMNFSELSGADGQYVFTISNARVEDVTKDNMAATLRADAEITLDDMGQEAGCVYDDATAGDFKAAQAAALEILAKEDPTYAELEAAQAAIDEGKAKLVAVGHIVMEFPTFNKTVTGTLGTVVNGWTGPETPVDLSHYDQSKLRLRMTITLEAPEGYSMRSCYLRMRLNVDGQEWGRQYAAEKVINAGKENAWVVDLPFDTTDTWKKENPIMPSDKVHQIYFIGYCKDATGSGTPTQTDLKLHFDNACIVDTTAEENLGAVETVGNGRVNIAGGMLYGADDTLTATTSSATSTFVGWKKNDTFVKANGEDDALALPVNGKQDVTAYFAEADEAVVVYTGKYNRVVDVQVVKDAAALVAPTAPAITGQTFVGWDEIGQLTMGEANIVKAIYTTDEVTEANGYTVDLTSTSNDNATSGKFYGFDDRTTVTAAAAPAGQKFSHWKVNGNIAGYTDTLTFYVSGNMTIEAVYVAEDVVVEQELSASITQNQMVANGSAYNFEVIGQTYLPEGYDLMAYGVIFAPNAETLTELATTGATEGATLDVVSSSNIPNRQYKITLEKVTAGRTRSAMAYITARNADGEIVTVYSGVETKVAE